MIRGVTHRGWLLDLLDLSTLNVYQGAKLFLFKVMILESGETRWLGVGVVFDNYDTELMPGWRKGTVGFHTDDSNIFDSIGQGRKTTGLQSTFCYFD